MTHDYLGQESTCQLESQSVQPLNTAHTVTDRQTDKYTNQAASVTNKQWAKSYALHSGVA